MNKIGIDFGTSYSAASWLNPVTNHSEVIIFQETGIQKMPSVVYYSPNEILVGQQAADILENSNGLPIELRADVLPYIFSSLKRQLKKGEKIELRGGQTVTQEEIIAEIFRKMKTEAERSCFRNHPVESVVLTYPVWFEDWQKEMLCEAAGLAGFSEIEMMKEPVAAVKGYVNSGAKMGHGVLVYDFGGGAFNVSFVEIDADGEYNIPIVSESCFDCGGDDIDALLYEFWEKLARQWQGVSIQLVDQKFDKGFLMHCRRHKEMLSFSVECDTLGVLPGFKPMRFQLQRDDFEQIIQVCVRKTLTLTQVVLERIKEEGYKVDSVILIGGNSRIPLVVKMLQEILPMELFKTELGDVAVVMGAMVPNKVYTIKDFNEMFREGDKQYQAQNYEEAYRLWSKLVANGYLDAQNNLGICYHRGCGVKVDFNMARQYYEAVAKREDAVGYYNLGLLLMDEMKQSELWQQVADALNKAVKLGHEQAKSMTDLFPLFSREPQLKNAPVAGSIDMIEVEGDDQIASFYIGKYLVTQKEWQEVMGNNPSNFKGDDLPVEKVTWYDCIKFCNALSEKFGYKSCYTIDGCNVMENPDATGFRLPSEMEWEFAARGGKLSKGYNCAGSNDINRVAWYGSNSGNKTHPVGTMLPNELGIYDMSGNVWEWCFNTYVDSYRVYRGGSWINYAVSCAVSNRGYGTPEDSCNFLGLRLVFSQKL